MGGRQPIEDKPLKKAFFDENLLRYCINCSEHGDYYNFYDSREFVSDFLTVFENVFVPWPNLDGLLQVFIYNYKSLTLPQDRICRNYR